MKLDKQSVTLLVIVVAVVSFGLGWLIGPKIENLQVMGSESLTEVEQIALDHFISVYIYGDPEKRELKKPGLVYIGTQKAAEEDEELVYIFYPLTGDLYYIHLEKEEGEWKVDHSYDKSVGRGGDYTFEEFTQTERYQYLRVYDWKEAMAE